MLGFGIAKGMVVTIKHFVNLKKFTVQYPEQVRPSAPAYRGAPALVFDETTGKARCVACGICARACPHGVIHVTGVEGADGKRRVARYEVEIVRCLFCGLCEEACPYSAVKMSHDFELSDYHRYSLVYDRERLEGHAELPSEMIGIETKSTGVRARLGAGKEVAQIK